MVGRIRRFLKIHRRRGQRILLERLCFIYVSDEFLCIWINISRICVKVWRKIRLPTVVHNLCDTVIRRICNLIALVVLKINPARRWISTINTVRLPVLPTAISLEEYIVNDFYFPLQVVKHVVRYAVLRSAGTIILVIWDIQTYVIGIVPFFVGIGKILNNIYVSKPVNVLGHLAIHPHSGSDPALLI